MQINILITLDRNFVQHADIMLTSLFINNREQSFTVYIVSDRNTDVSVVDKTIKRFSHVAVFFTIDNSLLNRFKVSLHASAANYFRVFLGEILPAQVQRVLYLDSDIIVRGCLKDLWSIDLGGNVVGAIPEYNMSPEKKTSLGIESGQSYFNSGVMLVDVALWRESDITKKAIDFIINNPELLEYWDQDALNAVLKDKWLKLAEQYNYLTPFCTGEFRNLDPVIIHFTGKSKPWQYMDKHPYKKEYYKYLKLTRWKDYKPEDATIGNFLRKYKLFPAWIVKTNFV